MDGPRAFESAYEAKMHANQGRGETRQTQISEQCAILAEKTEELLKLTSQLEAELERILRPTDEKRQNPLPSEVMGNGPLAPHADFLQSRNFILQATIDNLTGILRRVEL
jgi:hypothetical protein